MQLDTSSSHGSVGDLRWNLINLHLSSPILFFLTTLFDPVTRELVIHLRIEIPRFQVSTLRRVNTLSSSDIILSLLSRGEIHFFSSSFFDRWSLDCSIERGADNRIHTFGFAYIFYAISKYFFSPVGQN